MLRDKEVPDVKARMGGPLHGMRMDMKHIEDVRGLDDKRSRSGSYEASRQEGKSQAHGCIGKARNGSARCSEPKPSEVQ